MWIWIVLSMAFVVMTVVVCALCRAASQGDRVARIEPVAVAAPEATAEASEPAPQPARAVMSRTRRSTPSETPAEEREPVLSR